ncbi:NAD-dependent epimerase/dehydratase family protein [Amycolatopsis magusensis]|uniref:NAD-dependent epimerase/dehydratase family protein n=1 Tax=Amycolatopsis magusensis TaxID=882444 RepID=UPI0037B6D8B1
MLRVAVVGASGCVGRQICALSAQRGHDVLAIARKAAEHTARHRFVPLDVAGAPAESVAELLASRRIDVVVNAAGRWGPTEEEMVHSHLGVVRSLVAALELLGDAPRLVHIGSIHEYGPVRSGTAVHESTTPRPSTVYAQTKLAGSRMVLASGGVVLRSANTFGPYPPEETFFAALLRRLRAALDSGAPVDITIADAYRDFVDVRDVAAAVLAAAEAPAAGQAINIGSGVAMDMRELVMSLVAVAGFPGELLRTTSRQVPSHGGDWTKVDIGLAHRLLRWGPTFTVAESLRAMWLAA